MPLQALDITLGAFVGSSWSYYPETPNFVKISVFCPVGPWSLTDDLKTIGHLFYDTSTIVHHLVPICVFKLELWPINSTIGQIDSSHLILTLDLWPGPLYTDSFLVSGISCKCDDAIRRILWKMCDRQMDRHMDRGVDTAAWSQLKYGPLVTISTQQLGWLVQDRSR